jgi:hypothetical protein
MNNNKVKESYLVNMLLKADVQEHVFWGKTLVASYKLENGFTLIGVGSCVCPNNFDSNIGRKVAFEDVLNQLWKLEGYVLQNKLHEGLGQPQL